MIRFYSNEPAGSNRGYARCPGVPGRGRPASFRTCETTRSASPGPSHVPRGTTRAWSALLDRPLLPALLLMLEETPKRWKRRLVLGAPARLLGPDEVFEYPQSA